MNPYKILHSLLLGALLFSLAPTARAGLKTLNIVNCAGATGSPSPAFGGTSFGSVGPYEVICGTFTGAVDPANPHNAVIVDIENAPQDADGLVEYTVNFQIIRPVNLAAGSGRIIYDLPNRGGAGALSGPGVVLSEIPGSPYYFPNDLASIAISPSDNFLFALGINPDAIYTVTFNGATGELTQSTTTTISGEVSELILDPQGKFAFVNDSTDGTVLAYSVGSDGSLTSVPGSPFVVPAGGLPASLVITSDGNFLYAPLMPSGIAAFTVNRSTGALSNIVGSPFATTNQVFSLAIGAGGRFIYSIGDSDNEIEAFSIDGGSGALTALAGSPFAMPSQLSSLTVDASGKFLYATVQASTLAESAILGFAIDTSTGSLTTLTGSPYSSAPFPVDAVMLSIP